MKSLFFLMFGISLLSCNKSSDSGGGGSDKPCSGRNKDECVGSACTYSAATATCNNAGTTPAPTAIPSGIAPGQGGLGSYGQGCSQRTPATCAATGDCKIDPTTNACVSIVSGTSNCAQFSGQQQKCQSQAGCQFQPTGSCIDTNSLGGTSNCAQLPVANCNNTYCCVSLTNSCQSISFGSCQNQPYTPGVGPGAPGGTYPQGGGWYNPGGGSAPQGGGNSIGSLIALGGGIGALSGVSGGLSGMFNGFLKGATGVLGGALNNGLYGGQNGNGGAYPYSNPNNPNAPGYNNYSNPNGFNNGNGINNPGYGTPNNYNGYNYPNGAGGLNNNIYGPCANLQYNQCVNMSAQGCRWDQATNLCRS